MWAALTSLYVPAIVIVGAFLFIAVEGLEPNRRAALVLKCMILAAGGAAIANHLSPDGLLAAIAEFARGVMSMGRSISTYCGEDHCAAKRRAILGAGGRSAAFLEMSPRHQTNKRSANAARRYLFARCRYLFGRLRELW
jgi:hypothetical protein